MNDDRYLQLRCGACGNRRVVGSPEMVDHLRGLGMFKRQKEPDLQLVRELYAEQISLLRCGNCGQVGYGKESPEELDDEQWGGLRACEVCGQAIPPERLEVFPETLRCTGCQRLADSGQEAADPEYCPRCGAIMQLRQRGGAGLAGYVMRCPDCGYS